MGPRDKPIQGQRQWEELRVDIDKLADSFANSIHPRLDVLEKHRDDQFKVHQPATNKALDDIRRRLLKLEELRLPALNQRINALEDTLETLRAAVHEFLAPDIQTVATHLETLDDDVRAHEHRLAYLEESNVPGLPGDLEQIDNRVSDLEATRP